MTESNLELAVIGNGRTAALVEPSGRIVWWCLPRYDGDPVFCRLLAGNEEKGFTDVVLDGQVESRSEYLRNTAMVVTELTDGDGGAVRITDFAPRFANYGRSLPSAAAHTHHRADRRHAARHHPFSHHASLRRAGPVAFVRQQSHSLLARRRAGAADDRRAAVARGERSLFVLTRPVHMVFGVDEPFEGTLESTCREFSDRTRDYWMEWVRRLAFSIDWQDEIIRAAITLKLCSFEETGAIVAALTTSIPEGPGSGRTWDYRFCWMRDAFFVVRALNRIGATRTMEDFISYILSVAAGRADRVKPLYGVVHTDTLEERGAPALVGYNGDGPVRIGNAAIAQNQHDVYGSIIMAATPMFFDRRCPSRAMPHCFGRSSRSANRRRGWRSSRTPASGNIAGASACIRIRRRCAGPVATGWRRSPPISGLPTVPNIGAVSPTVSAGRCWNRAGTRNATLFRPLSAATISTPAVCCWPNLG